MLGRIVFYRQAGKQSNFGLILGGTPDGQNVLNGLDCATNDERRGPDRGGKSKEEAEVASGRQACNEEARYRCLKGVVEDGGAVAALDATYKVPGFQKRDTLQVDLVTGRVEDVVDLDRVAGVESDTQRSSALLGADDTRLRTDRDRLVTQTRP